VGTGLGTYQPGRAANNIHALAHKSYYLKRKLAFSRLTCNSHTVFGVLTVHEFADEPGAQMVLHKTSHTHAFSCAPHAAHCIGPVGNVARGFLVLTETIPIRTYIGFSLLGTYEIQRGRLIHLMTCHSQSHQSCSTGRLSARLPAISCRAIID
jgi:hypothetical protein